jgi:hypothetical protein
MFAEEWATSLLVLHTVLAAAVVGASTHLVVWMRGYLRGQYTRHKAIKRFALYSAVLFLATFIVGNVIYPTYKVRVRAQYLDDPAAVSRDLDNRAEARAKVIERHVRHLRGEGRPVPAVLEGPEITEAPGNGGAVPGETARISRWFDVKEHWVAMGMILSLALYGLLRFWNPSREGAGVIAPIVFLMAVGAAGTAWLGAIIGIVVASYRAIGGVG